MIIWGDLTMLTGRIRGLKSAAFGDEPPRSDEVGAGGAVTSVAGRTGAVVLSHTDIIGFTANAISPTEKGANNGVAPLSATGKIPTAYLPSLAITTTYVVANQAEQLALTNEEGDLVVRTDQGKTYIRSGGTAGTMADYIEIITPSAGSVVSVNGYTGAVVLSASDIAGFSTVAISGSYADLSSKPTYLPRRVLVNNTATGAISINWALYDVVYLTLVGDVVLTFSGAAAEQGCVLRLKQDTVGGRTVTLPATVRYSTTLSGFTASLLPSVVDRVGFIFDSGDSKYDLVSSLKGLS